MQEAQRERYPHEILMRHKIMLMKKVAHHSAVAACLALLPYSSGCSSSPEFPGWEGWGGNDLIELADFPGLGGSEQFDEREPAASWTRGDEMVFGIRFRKDHFVKRWIVRLQPADADSTAMRQGSACRWMYDWKTADGRNRDIVVVSHMGPVDVRVADKYGTMLKRTRVSLPRDLLDVGFVPAAESGIEISKGLGEGPRAGEREAQAIAEAVTTATALIETLQSNEALRDYFWEVVDPPSIWTVVSGLGVRATLKLELHSAMRVVTPREIPPQDDTFQVPITVDINGRPALSGDLVVVRSGRPYALAGGIVEVRLRRASDSDTRIVMKLLSARCGY